MKLRFSIRDLLLITAIIALAVGWWIAHRQLTAQRQGFGGSFIRDKNYDKCKNLAEAVHLVQGRLTTDRKREYAELLSEARVRMAIKDAIANMDKMMKNEKDVAVVEYWENVAKPIFVDIVKNGTWPAGATFDGFYGATNEKGHSDGLGLRLNIVTPDAKFTNWGLPIVDLYFGRFW
jgi:hypothetical protein